MVCDKVVCVKDSVVKDGVWKIVCDGVWKMVCDKVVWKMVCERWCVTKWCVKDGVWKMVCDGVWKMVCDKVVWKMVCERWCVTKWCVKDGVWQSCVWKIVCVKVVCEREGVTKLCVKDGVWQVVVPRFLLKSSSRYSLVLRAPQYSEFWTANGALATVLCALCWELSQIKPQTRGNSDPIPANPGATMTIPEKNPGFRVREFFHPWIHALPDCCTSQTIW